MSLLPPIDNRFSSLQDDACIRLRELPLDQFKGSVSALERVALISPFVLDTLLGDKEMLLRLEQRGELEHTPSAEALHARLQALCTACEGEEAFESQLRRFRKEQMVGIIWRDVCREESDIESAWDTSKAVTQLAETCLQIALDWLQKTYEPRWGRAFDNDGSQMSLIILGMGKFGAGELNLSSDIDLIFAFAHEGETRGGRRALSHQEYFTRIGQRLIHAMDAILVDGFVFRVDMRLRPLGEGGPLVGSFSSLDRYYQDQGREWERFALLKARPVAGDIEAGMSLLSSLSPFIYRRYVDFGAIQSLRDMKAMINREVRRRGLEANIKLGAGGIREIEFVVQVFQLVRGGRDTELQTPSLAKAMVCIRQLALLPEEQMDWLEGDYLLLRDCEHVLQAMHDTQTQNLPDNDEDRARLAYALEYTDWPSLLTELTKRRERVNELFESIIRSDDEEEQDDDDLLDWSALWNGEMDQDEAQELLASYQFQEPEKSLKRLQALRQSRQVHTMQRVGHERLDALMPVMLNTIALEHTVSFESDQPAEGATSDTTLQRHFIHQPPDVALERILTLIEAVLRRTAYLSLLRESESARKYLVRLCASSLWIAEELTRHPMLLDELLTPSVLFSTQTRESLTSQLNLDLLRIPEEDEEAQLEALCRFKHAQVLAVAASDLAGARPLMQVSDALTLIAEVILDRVVNIAWRRVVGRYGNPQGIDADNGLHPSRFMVVGYGKLGGIELGYGSDLDLVFIYDAPPRGMTDGARSIDNTTFFTRLGQRIIHLLTTMTPSGVLYEVDMRLRPSGNSGLLVTTLEAFADYQQQHAWTWEHQALVRARFVAGDPSMVEPFTTVRNEVLGKHRETETLRQEVVGMRDKMRQHLGSQEAEPTEFDIKQDAGGMVDIEFMAQYAVLAFSHEHPELLEWTDNVRILERLCQQGPWPCEDIQHLHDAYLAYRDVSHLRALAKQNSKVSVDQFQQQRSNVVRAWNDWMLSP